MLVPLLLGSLLQSAPLPPATWKERNQPDMPILPTCDLGSGAVAHTISDLPSPVSNALMRFFGSEKISDAGGPFNSTDVVDGHVPQRRFLRAYEAENYWIIWFEVGGIVSGPRTLAFYRDSRSSAASPAYHARPGTIFAGNLCAASKAILAGVVAAAA